MEKSLEMTQILLRAGAKADAYNDLLGQCAIHIAIDLKSREILKALLEYSPG